MDYTSARKPITIDRESESSWYTQTITRKALSSIPDQFKKMPKFETLKFSHRKGFGPTVLANALHAALVLVPDTVVSAPEDIASKKRKSDEGSESAPLKIKRRDYSHTIRQRPIIISRLSSPENPVMAKRTEAQPGTSKAENDLLKATIATQTRPLEVNQARV
ncbi:hypothetical protein AA0116_g1337 [Alternaria tenuissima]|uniref:Uncharacterized protein n=1 Tax=Alternaria tenuissima TaxID=119927 RepID=A0AB37WLS9_9PLEO|nr:hypothetical protein AA0115_g6010 [Alternaria tenuissima]RYO67743.1 hypothetical protein AA0116_g1337 [Alternaria tenuissima]